MPPALRPLLQIRFVVEGELQQTVRAVNIELPADVVPVIIDGLESGKAMRQEDEPTRRQARQGGEAPGLLSLSSFNFQISGFSRASSSVSQSSVSFRFLFPLLEKGAGGVRKNP